MSHSSGQYGPISQYRTGSAQALLRLTQKFAIESQSADAVIRLQTPMSASLSTPLRSGSRPPSASPSTSSSRPSSALTRPRSPSRSPGTSTNDLTRTPGTKITASRPWSAASLQSGFSGVSRISKIDADHVIREREWSCVIAMEEANELCQKLKMSRVFKLLRDSVGALRVQVCEGSTVIREVDPERLHREVQRLRTMAIHIKASKEPPPQFQLETYSTQEEERRATDLQQKQVLQDTLKLADRLQAQIRELKRRGGKFSPFE